MSANFKVPRTSGLEMKRLSQAKKVDWTKPHVSYDCLYCGVFQGFEDTAIVVYCYCRVLLLSCIVIIVHCYCRVLLLSCIVIIVHCYCRVPGLLYGSYNFHVHGVAAPVCQQEGYQPDRSAIYNWLPGHRKPVSLRKCTSILNSKKI